MKILVVEDDKNVAELVKDELTARDHTVELVSDGAEGSFMGRTFDFDAIIMDNNLPKKSGLEACKEIRSAGKTTPILFLSVTDDPDTKVQALDSGADDYLTKPFELQELYARLRALTRRPSNIKSPVLSIDDLVLDSDKNIVTRGGERIHLTRKEFNILEYMMKNAGNILSRAMLMEHVWSADSNPFSNTVEAHITNIRRKIRGNSEKPDLIHNIPGRGYIIDTEKNLEKF